MDIEFYKNLDYIRKKYYNIHQEYIYNEWINYYHEYLSMLYTIFSKYYSVPFNQFIRIIYETQ